MSHTKSEVSLLEYVITYLQEEQRTNGKYSLYAASDIRQFVAMALDAYAGGAR